MRGRFLVGLDYLPVLLCADLVVLALVCRAQSVLNNLADQLGGQRRCPRSILVKTNCHSGVFIKFCHSVIRQFASP